MISKYIILNDLIKAKFKTVVGNFLQLEKGKERREE